MMCVKRHRHQADHRAAVLAEHGHHDVAEALQFVVAGVDNLPAAMGAASGWQSRQGCVRGWLLDKFRRVMFAETDEGKRIESVHPD
jgi:hypothetical protein